MYVHAHRKLKQRPVLRDTITTDFVCGHLYTNYCCMKPYDTKDAAMPTYVIMAQVKLNTGTGQSSYGPRRMTKSAQLCTPLALLQLLLHESIVSQSLEAIQLCLWSKVRHKIKQSIPFRARQSKIPVRQAFLSNVASLLGHRAQKQVLHQLFMQQTSYYTWAPLVPFGKYWHVAP